MSAKALSFLNTGIHLMWPIAPNPLNPWEPTPKNPLCPESTPTDQPREIDVPGKTRHHKAATMHVSVYCPANQTPQQAENTTIVIHGFGSDRNFGKPLGLLAYQEGDSVVLADHLAHGLSQFKDLNDPALGDPFIYADMLLKTFEALGIKKGNLVCHSMGVRIASAMAVLLAHQELDGKKPSFEITNQVLITGWMFDNAAGKAIDFFNLITQPVMRQYKPIGFMNLFAVVAGKDNIRSVKQDPHLNQMAENMAEKWRGSNALYNISQIESGRLIEEMKKPSIKAFVDKIPTTVISAYNDTLVSIENGLWLAYYHQVPLYIIQGQHLAPYTNPDKIHAIRKGKPTPGTMILEIGAVNKIAKTNNLHRPRAPRLWRHIKKLQQPVKP